MRFCDYGGRFSSHDSHDWLSRVQAGMRSGGSNRVVKRQSSSSLALFKLLVNSMVVEMVPVKGGIGSI